MGCLVPLIVDTSMQAMAPWLASCAKSSLCAPSPMLFDWATLAPAVPFNPQLQIWCGFGMMGTWGGQWRGVHTSAWTHSKELFCTCFFNTTWSLMQCSGYGVVSCQQCSDMSLWWRSQIFHVSLPLKTTPTTNNEFVSSGWRNIISPLSHVKILLSWSVLCNISAVFFVCVRVHVSVCSCFILQHLGSHVCNKVYEALPSHDGPFIVVFHFNYNPATANVYIRILSYKCMICIFH